MNKNERKIGAILSYVLLLVNTLIAVFYTPLLTRYLGQSEYGLYSLINSIIGYLTILDLGFGNALIVYTAKYKEKNDENSLKKLYGMFLVIYCIIGFVALLLGIGLYFSADMMFANSMTGVELSKAKIMLLILTFNLVVTFPFTVYSSIITASEKFVFKKVLAIARTLINPIIMLPFLLLGYKSITLVIVTTILNLSVLVSNYLYCKIKLKIKIRYYGMDKKLLKTIFAYSFFIFLNIIIDKINWSVDQFILGSVAGTIAVSVYSIASNFNTMYLSFSTAISGVLLPKISKMVESKASNKELTNEFIKVSRIQYLVLFFIIIVFIFFGKDFIVLLYGSEYEISYYIGLILMIPVTVPLTQNLGISILQAKNMHRFRSVVLAIIAIINVIISIYLAKLYGGVGSAIGTSISLIIGNIILIDLYYHFKVKLNMISYWKNFITMTLKLCFSVLPLFLVFKIDLNLLLIVLLVSLYAIIYIVYAYYVVMNKYEKGLVDKVLTKLKGFIWKKS